MSGDIGDKSANFAKEAKETSGKLLDASGQVINQASQRAESGLEQASDYIHQQPLSAVLIALGIGYIIGRLKLL